MNFAGRGIYTPSKKFIYKLSTAVSDVAGVSGMDIIRAIAGGQRDPLFLANLRSKKCKKDESLFIEALTGNFQEEHIFALQQALAQYDFSNSQLIQCDKTYAWVHYRQKNR